MKPLLKKLLDFNLSPHSSFALAFFYLSIINLFFLRTTPELIILQFSILILLFKKYRFSQFFQDWFPLVALFMLYEFSRGLADNLSPFTPHTKYLIYELELLLFHSLPTQTLQHQINSPSLLNLALFFYSLFFYYSFAVGLLIWYYKRSLFSSYKIRFLALSFLSLLFFLLLPTAPPWLAAQTKHLDIHRLIFNRTILNSFADLTLYQYLFNNNALAAFPSLHTAWPAFTSLFLIKHFPSHKLSYLSSIIPIMIAFSVIWTGEHYVLDILFGLLLALAFNLPLKSTLHPSKPH